MQNTIATLTSLIPAEVDFMSMLKFICVFAAGALIIGFLARLFLGKRSSLNHAVSSAMGILFVYAVTVLIYTFNPVDLAQHLAPLPFVTFEGDTLYLMSFRTMGFPAICSQVLSMVILAFFVNLLDSFIPKGKRITGWYLLRFLTVILAIVVHAVVSWLFNTYLPDLLVTYAPMILLGILAAMLILSVLNIILSVVLTVVNPIIGAAYTFFFSNIIGKQLTKAVLSTALLCAVVYALEHFGYVAISIAGTALGNYIPLIAALLVLWYLIGHVL